MSDPLTDAQLAEIAAREKAATPGPWFPVTMETESTLTSGVSLDDNFPPSAADRYLHGRNVVAGCSGNNAAFIAHARADVPALLAEVARLREENKRLSDWISPPISAGATL